MTVRDEKTTGEWTPVTAADVTDEKLLPRRFDQFQHEVRGDIHDLTATIKSTFVEIREVLSDVRKLAIDLNTRMLSAETRLDALEAAQKTKRKARR